MRGKLTVLALFGFCASVALTYPSFANEKTADNPNGCKFVERKGGPPPGSIASSVTAGGGHVSAYTSTGAGGNAVTVHSGDGNSVATAGTTGNGSSSAMVMNGNGDCTIYVDPGERKEH